MRRILVMASSFVVLAGISAGCQHDGRTLRPPKDGQTASVSTTAPSTTSTSIATPTDPFQPTTQVPVESATGTTLYGLTVPWPPDSAIDQRYTCDGLNVSPALSWTQAPAGTVEIAITVTDDDNPGFVHWAIAGISPAAIANAEGAVPTGAIQGINGSGKLGYTGPCPPAGSAHTYRFTVHYLVQQIELGDGANGSDLILAINDVTTATAQVTAVYSRP